MKKIKVTMWIFTNQNNAYCTSFANEEIWINNIYLHYANLRYNIMMDVIMDLLYMMHVMIKIYLMDIIM